MDLLGNLAGDIFRSRFRLLIMSENENELRQIISDYLNYYGIEATIKVVCEVVKEKFSRSDLWNAFTKFYK